MTRSQVVMFVAGLALLAAVTIGIVWPTESAVDLATLSSPPVTALDPHKGKWGGQSVDVDSGFALAARITPVPGDEDLFEIRLRVNAPPSHRRTGTIVAFHLHPSFSPSVVRTELRDGAAELVRRGWGAFTVGVEVESAEGPPIRLELDLASVSDAPRRFRER